MRAGQLRNRITIQSSTATPDAAGQLTRTWSTFAASVPAKVESVTGGETLRGRQIAAETKIVFTVRYLAGVTAQMRVSFEGRTFGIARCGDPYGDHRELRIEAAEAV